MNYKIVFFLLGFFFVSCRNDFDPIKDSSYIDVTFHLNLDDAFSQTLIHEKGEFFLCDFDTFPSNSVMQLCAYCYNEEGELIQTVSKNSSSLQTLDVKFRCLDSTRVYSCLFVCDFVHQDSINGLMGNWSFFTPRLLESLYMSNYNIDADLLKDVVLSVQWQGNPTKTIDTLKLIPITCGGYVRIINIEWKDVIFVQPAYSYSTYLWSLTSCTAPSWYKEKEYTSLGKEGEILFPMIYSSSNSFFVMNVLTQVLASIDTIKVVVENYDKRPFVCTVDCESMSKLNTIFY